MNLLPRELSSTLELYLSEVPSVGLVGPRQVGKSTLALLLNERFGGFLLDLQRVQPQEFTDDPTLFFRDRQNQLVVIDEIQRRPELFSVLRPTIDEHREPGRFLLLGSASPTLIRKASETLAGRILYTELTPFNYVEVTRAGIPWQDHLAFGGYPEPLLRLSQRVRRRWADDYIQTFLTRDLVELGVEVVDRDALERLLRMIAHVHGGLFNANELARGLPISPKTVQRYVSILQEAFLIRVLQPWYRNYGKRLIKSPRLYWRDSGLRHALLNVGTYSDLLTHPALGSSWEGYAIEEICRAAPDTRAYFYRTQDGSELDLILEFSSIKRWAFEMKFSTGPSLSKGTYNAIATVEPEHTYVVTPASERFPLRKGMTLLALPQVLELVRAEALS